MITVDAVRTLFGAGQPEHSTVGIVLAAVSLAIMPFLSWFERRTGRELGSASAVADSKQTLICTYLSAVLLVGLVLNSTLGWTWADPVAALVIAAVALKEGVEAWRGDACCTPASALIAGDQNGRTAMAAGRIAPAVRIERAFSIAGQDGDVKLMIHRVEETPV